jgi:hypothetical protein
MISLLTSGHIAAMILALTVFEVAALTWFHRATGRGIALSDLLPNVLAGDFLLLAWLLASARAGWPWIGAALAGALLSHATDLVRRWGP